MSFSEAMRELARIGATLTDRERASIDHLGCDHLPHPLVQEGAQRLSLLLQGKSDDVSAENIHWAVEELIYTTDREHFSPAAIGVLALAQLCMYLQLQPPSRWPTIQTASRDVVAALPHLNPAALTYIRDLVERLTRTMRLENDDEAKALGVLLEAVTCTMNVHGQHSASSSERAKLLKTISKDATTRIRSLEQF
jgi:hypothetical protein